MLDIARLATRGVYPANNTLGVITVSGGAGVIISDAADAVGLPMPEMPQASQERLLKLLPFAAPRNPVDVTAQYLNEMSLISTFTDALIAEGKYTSILGFFTYTGGVASIAPRLREQLKIARNKHPDCIFALSLMASRELIRQYEEDGFAVFEDPARAVVGHLTSLPAYRRPSSNRFNYRQATQARQKRNNYSPPQALLRPQKKFVPVSTPQYVQPKKLAIPL
jgi:acyl-CoA synthetase (NDP forming)